MASNDKAAAGTRSPARHEEASSGKERSRSLIDRHCRTKSNSRDRKGWGSHERADSKRHIPSRKNSRSCSPSRSRSRGKSAFRGRQYSPPRKRPKHSRSRSSSPALLLGPHAARQSTSPAAYGPARPLQPGRVPAPYDARWQPRGYEGPTHREPMTYGSYSPNGPPYGSQPPARRWAAGPSSRFGGRIEGRSPPPHWAGRVNPTTGSPIHDASPDDPRECLIAALPQGVPSQWGTSIGWERIGDGTHPANVGPSLRHSPISPARDNMDRDAVHSAMISRHRYDSTAPAHSALSPPTEATGQSPSHTSSAAGAEECLQPHQAQAGRTGPSKAAQELAGEVHPHAHGAYHSAADAIPKQGAGVADVMTLQDMDQEACKHVAQKMNSIAAQNVQQPLEAGYNGKQGRTVLESELRLPEIGTSATKQASLLDPPTMSQGTRQHTVASPEAVAPRQAAGQAAQQAEERLRELVMGADYSEKDWYYVDPQGATQGPCCIAEFRGWMHDLQMDPQLIHALKQFSEVHAWKDGAPFSVKMKSLMATVIHLSPSPPSSPNPRDTKLAGNGALV